MPAGRWTTLTPQVFRRFRVVRVGYPVAYGRARSWRGGDGTHAGSVSSGDWRLRRAWRPSRWSRSPRGRPHSCRLRFLPSWTPRPPRASRSRFSRTASTPFATRFTFASPSSVSARSIRVARVHAQRADLAIAPAQPFLSIVPALAGFALPYLFASGDEAERATTERTISDELTIQSLGGGIRFLALWWNGARILASRYPIEHPTDVRGTTIGISPNDEIAAQTVEAFGARPVALQARDRLARLRTSSIDVVETTLEEFVAGGRPRPRSIHHLDRACRSDGGGRNGRHTLGSVVDSRTASATRRHAVAVAITSTAPLKGVRDSAWGDARDAPQHPVEARIAQEMLSRELLP